MRRVLLVLLGLSLLGFVVAAASSVSTNSEDIESFTTQVSISVPSNNLPSTIYLQPGADGAGSLELVPPTDNSHTSTTKVRLGSLAVDVQAQDGFYVVWKSAPAPAGGYVLSGSNVVLHMWQDGGNANRMTVGLLDCPGGAPNVTLFADGCNIIGLAVSDPTGGNGNKERFARFGPMNTSIAAGRELRLKIVNRNMQPPPIVVSTIDWDIQTGYLPARPVRLELNEPP